MRTGVVWVEGTLSDDPTFTRSQLLVEGLTFVRSLFNAPSHYSLVLVTSSPQEVVEHWLRHHGCHDLLHRSVEKLWEADRLDRVIEDLTRSHRHDVRLWIDSDEQRALVVREKYGISTIVPDFSTQALVWASPPEPTRFAPFAADVEG